MVGGREGVARVRGVMSRMGMIEEPHTLQGEYIVLLGPHAGV